MTTARIIQQPISVLSRTRKGLGRWLPVAIIGVFVIGGSFRPVCRPIRSKCTEPPRATEGAGHRVAECSLSARQRRARPRPPQPHHLRGARFPLRRGCIGYSVSARSACFSGMLAGYLRGWAETVIMRLVDVFLSIPAILLAIIIVAVLGPGS